MLVLVAALFDLALGDLPGNARFLLALGPLALVTAVGHLVAILAS